MTISQKKTTPPNTNTEPENLYVGPWPWYVFVVLGTCLAGFFPWLLVAWGLFTRKRVLGGCLTVGLALTLYYVLDRAVYLGPLLWWQLACAKIVVNLAWALSAWIYQRKAFGPAPRRYYPREWRDWIVPVCTGIFVGACLGFVISAMDVSGEAMKLFSQKDPLNRQSMVWTLFGGIWPGASFGVLLGGWWAGEGRRFSVSHVFSFLLALLLAVLVFVAGTWLFLFIAADGIHTNLLEAQEEWAAVSPWLRGWKAFLYSFAEHVAGGMGLAALALMVGAPRRIRDFFLRVSMVPLVFVLLVPGIRYSAQWDELAEQFVVENTVSSDPEVREEAFFSLERLLLRYPEHQQWPRLAERLASYAYRNGEYDKARVWYERLVEKCAGNNKNAFAAEYAQAILDAPDFGKNIPVTRLAVPVPDYEEYLTANWMTLLSVVRYWEGKDVPDSQIKIRLKALSTSEDKIALNPLGDYVDLDDAASVLGYETRVLPANAEDVQALVRAGFPVLMRHYYYFALISGIDPSRSMVTGYFFKNLSLNIRTQAPEEFKEILSVIGEGKGKSRKRLQLIANQAYEEEVLEYFGSARMHHAGAFIAVVYPKSRAKELEQTLAQAVGEPPARVRAISQGLLGGMIGFSYAKYADPVNAVAWAQKAAAMVSDSYPLYVAHVAHALWLAREFRPKASVPLGSTFPEVARVDAFFKREDVAAFLARARERYTAELENVPWELNNIYTQNLQLSDAEDRRVLNRIFTHAVSVAPNFTWAWERLVKSYGFAQDAPARIKALEGLVSAAPLDFKAKVNLAYAYVAAGQVEKVQRVLDTIDVSKVRYNADYYFCRGAVAHHEADKDAALRYYEKALEMRRYRALYFLQYGRLLLEQGDNKDARKALAWAAKIDGGDTIRKQAMQLLAQTEEN